MPSRLHRVKQGRGSLGAYDPVILLFPFFIPIHEIVGHNPFRVDGKQETFDLSVSNVVATAFRLQSREYWRLVSLSQRPPTGS